MIRGLTITWLSLALTSLAFGAEAAPTFTKKPTAVREGDRVRIEFAVDRETDVAVSIEDAKGQIVRHLVAGVLGKNPPEPLRADSLAQELEWDLRDDAGRTATGGPFKAGVSLGMKPVFDAKMFSDTQRLAGLVGIGVGPGGELYTKGGLRDGGMGPGTDMRVYDREGKYHRTIAPFAADLAYERVASFGAFKTGEDGRYIPRIHDTRYYCFYPAEMSSRTRYTQLAVDGEGRVFFLSSWRGTMTHVCVLDKDGGVPRGWTFRGKGIGDRASHLNTHPADVYTGFLAMSSDDRCIYVSGLEKKTATTSATSSTITWSGSGSRTAPRNAARWSRFALPPEERAGLAKDRGASEGDGLDESPAEGVAMNCDLDSIYRKSNAQSRSLSAENPSGEKGQGGMVLPENTRSAVHAAAAKDMGRGWKVQPCIPLAAGESVDIMDVDGPGLVRHIWITKSENFDFSRWLVLRAYWDGEEKPSVECPLGDFFCCAWGLKGGIEALPFNVNSSRGLNCFLPMPFRKHARINVHNDSSRDLDHLFYTVNYTLEDVAEDALYLHAQWRRENPVKYGDVYTLLDGVRGWGQYVGTFMAWQQNSSGWWGEGEIKMYLDGDEEFPTICGTGTEDYFGGGWCFREGGYSAPYLGYRIVSGEYRTPGTRMVMYRFHLPDPIYFREDLRVTMQALGWREDRRWMPLQDDISSVAYWYQTEPHAPFRELPGRDYREVK